MSSPVCCTAYTLPFTHLWAHELPRHDLDRHSTAPPGALIHAAETTRPQQAPEVGTHLRVKIDVEVDLTSWMDGVSSLGQALP